MKQKFSCTITLQHNTQQKLFWVENLPMLGILVRSEIDTRCELFDNVFSRYSRARNEHPGVQKYHLQQLLS